MRIHLYSFTCECPVFPALAFPVFEKTGLGLYVVGPYRWCKFEPHIQAGLHSLIIRKGCVFTHGTDWDSYLAVFHCQQILFSSPFRWQHLESPRFMQGPWHETPAFLSQDHLKLWKPKILVFTKMSKCSWTNCGFRINLLLCLPDLSWCSDLEMFLPFVQVQLYTFKEFLKGIMFRFLQDFQLLYFPPNSKNENPSSFFLFFLVQQWKHLKLFFFFEREALDRFCEILLVVIYVLIYWEEF